jgi:hypothetical protein
MTLLASTAGDVARYALAAFLLLSGLGLAYMLVRLGGTFSRLSSFIRGTERELLPVITKSGGTVDRVNTQLDKMDLVTDSAVDMAQSADTAVRTVTYAIQKPVIKMSGLAAGLTHGVSRFKATRDWSQSVRAGKDAAARREADLADELRRAGAEQSP